MLATDGTVAVETLLKLMLVLLPARLMLPLPARLIGATPLAASPAPAPQLIRLIGTRLTRMLASAGTSLVSSAYSSPVPVLVSLRPKAPLSCFC